MGAIDEATLKMIIEEGIDPTRLKVRPTQGLPPNTAGIPNLLVKETPELRGSNTSGFVLSDPRIKQMERNRGMAQAMFVAPGASPETVAHEAEHIMARTQLGHPAKINDKFSELINKPNARGDFVRAAIDMAPYLKSKYGLSNAYFDPRILKRNEAATVLYEQLASLAAVEQTLGVDLTKDPELRKTLFKDKDVRETYNALTGLRQTRLDPRDIAPYTRVPEPKETAQSLLEKTKKSLGFNGGGSTKII